MRTAFAGLVLFGSATASAADRTADAPTLTSGQPAGFETLLQQQETLADLFVAGRAIGQARIRYASGQMTFLDVDAVVAAIPDLVDAAAVRAALGAPDLDPHAGLICPADADRATCGILKPAVAGVIFDESRFRIDLFVAPRLLAVHPVAPRAYLPRPSAGLSLVDQIGGTVAGSGGSADYSIQNRAILGYRTARVRSDLSYSSRYGLLVDTLAGEVDAAGIRYVAGAMWVPGLDLTGRRRIVGAGIQSQLDTRLDRSLVAGSPLVVSLALRARVDILRDGRLLTSRTYDAGNQTLDTSGLPDGAYAVVLHIQEAGGATRDERRFFTRNAAIAAIGDPIWFAYAGVLANDRRGALIAASRIPFYEAGIARRLTPHLALDATVIGTDRTALLEVGGYWLGQAAQVRAAALGSVRGDVGLVLQASSSGSARLNYNLDMRRVWSRRDAPLIPFGDDPARDTTTLDLADRTAQLSAGSFTQIDGTISYSLQPGQVGVTGFYRVDATASRSYGIGPTVYFPLAQRRGLQVALRGDLALSNRGRSAFIGISFQRLRGTSALTSSLGARSTATPGSRDATAIVGGVAAAWQRQGVLGGDVAVAGGVEREIDGTLVRGRADLHTPVASLYADVAQPVGGSNGATQYGVSFQTTAAAAGGGLVFAGRDRNDSMIVVSVDRAGVASHAPFEVLVDNTPRGTVRAGEALSVSVPAYRQYAVRIRPIGSDLIRIDAAVRQVSVYPGNVARLRWAAQRVVALFGRIVWPDGSAAADATVYASGAIGNTDANGYFQIEAAGNAVLKVQSTDGRRCEVPINATASAEGYVALGTLVCPRAWPALRMAAAAP